MSKITIPRLSLTGSTRTPVYINFESDNHFTLEGGKKKPELMNKLKKGFVKGCLKVGIVY